MARAGWWASSNARCGTLRSLDHTKCGRPTVAGQLQLQLQFVHWAKRGVWRRLFELLYDPDRSAPARLDIDYERTSRPMALKEGDPPERAAKREALGSSRGGGGDPVEPVAEPQARLRPHALYGAEPDRAVLRPAQALPVDRDALREVGPKLPHRSATRLDPNPAPLIDHTLTASRTLGEALNDSQLSQSANGDLFQPHCSMQGGFARKYYTVEIFPVITSPTPNALSEQNATPAVKNVFDYGYEPSAEMHHHAYLIPALHRAFPRPVCPRKPRNACLTLGVGMRSGSASRRSGLHRHWSRSCRGWHQRCSESLRIAARHSRQAFLLHWERIRRSRWPLWLLPRRYIFRGCRTSLRSSHLCS